MNEPQGQEGGLAPAQGALSSTLTKPGNHSNAGPQRRCAISIRAGGHITRKPCDRAVSCKRLFDGALKGRAALLTLDWSVLREYPRQ